MILSRNNRTFRKSMDYFKGFISQTPAATPKAELQEKLVNDGVLLRNSRL